MALKATIHKVDLELADIDQNVYSDHNLTIARHPSETDERLLIRLFAFAHNVPANTDHGALEFARDMWDPEEPALWQKDLTGEIVHWIEVGQPDEKLLLRMSARVGRVSVYTYASSTTQWWSGMASKLTRAQNLSVWQIPAEQSAQLARLAQRSMKINVTIQEGAIWVGEGERSVEVAPQLLFGAK